MTRQQRRTARRGTEQGSRGQGLVEFALVVPVIALLVFGFIDVGRAVFEFNTLTNAARQAARVAAVNQLDPATPTDCNESHPVDDPSNPHWTFRGCAIAAGQAVGVVSTDVSITYASPPGANLTCTAATLDVGCIASVTVAHAFSPITPIAGTVIGSIPMSATSQMPVERLFP